MPHLQHYTGTRSRLKRHSKQGWLWSHQIEGLTTKPLAHRHLHQSRTHIAILLNVRGIRGGAATIKTRAPLHPSAYRPLSVHTSSLAHGGKGTNSLLLCQFLMFRKGLDGTVAVPFVMRSAVTGTPRGHTNTLPFVNTLRGWVQPSMHALGGIRTSKISDT